MIIVEGDLTSFALRSGRQVDGRQAAASYHLRKTPVKQIGSDIMALMPHRPAGIIAAAATPLRADLSPALDELPIILDHLARLGCHGALVLGTTGEGPAFSVEERKAIFRAAARWRQARNLSGFHLLGGTGCANLPETIAATRAVFDLGLDGAVILPAFYFKNVSADGLADYFQRAVRGAVPQDGRFYVYHIPRVSGVGIPFETIAALWREFPEQFAGIKDSSADLNHTFALRREFPQLDTFTGTDSHVAEALKAGAVGAITALANACGDLARAIYDHHRLGDGASPAVERLARARLAFDRYPSVPAVKSLLADLHGLPHWPVRPPLQSLDAEHRAAVHAEIRQALQ